MEIGIAFDSSSALAMLMASASSDDNSIRGGAPKESCRALAPIILALSKRVRWSGPISPVTTSTGAFFLDGPGLGWPAVARTPLTTLTLGAFLTGAGFGVLGVRLAFAFLGAAEEAAAPLEAAPLCSLAEEDVMAPGI